jgi:hypothetical protein
MLRIKEIGKKKKKKKRILKKHVFIFENQKKKKKKKKKIFFIDYMQTRTELQSFFYEKKTNLYLVISEHTMLNLIN